MENIGIYFRTKPPCPAFGGVAPPNMKIGTGCSRLKSYFRIKITISVFLSFLLLVFLSCGRKDESGKAIIGETAPNFQYYDMNGNYGSLWELKGKVVLLRFWADWCPYCKYEMPRINAFYKRLRKKDFEVIAVNVGQTNAVVEAFTAQLSLIYPMILDPEGKLARLYGVKGIPTNFFIDQKGIIKEILVGEIFISDQVLFDYLKPFFPGEDF
ncbi:MAG: TlpA disulfide reductase family protein [Pseudomonadota bacterium]